MSPHAQTTVILAGHGSRSTDANIALRSLATSLGARLGLAAIPAYLEFAEPSISAAISSGVSGGASSIVVVPYFLHPGMHVSRDIVAIVDAARIAHPQVAFAIAPFFGSHPAVGEMLVDLTQQTLAGHRRPEAV